MLCWNDTTHNIKVCIVGKFVYCHTIYNLWKDTRKNQLRKQILYWKLQKLNLLRLLRKELFHSRHVDYKCYRNLYFSIYLWILRINTSVEASWALICYMLTLIKVVYDPCKIKLLLLLGRAMKMAFKRKWYLVWGLIQQVFCLVYFKLYMWIFFNENRLDFEEVSYTADPVLEWPACPVIKSKGDSTHIV